MLAFFGAFWVANLVAGSKKEHQGQTLHWQDINLKEEKAGPLPPVL